MGIIPPSELCPIHLNFPIRCVLKAIIYRKKLDCFTVTWESFFFFKKTLFCKIVHACGIWLIFPLYHDLFLFFMFIYYLSTGFELAVRNSRFAKRFGSLRICFCIFSKDCESLKSDTSWIFRVIHWTSY